MISADLIDDVYVVALTEGIPWDFEFGVLSAAEREAIQQRYFDSNGQAIRRA